MITENGRLGVEIGISRIEANVERETILGKYCTFFVPELRSGVAVKFNQ
jgi:hypothetical protein